MRDEIQALYDADERGDYKSCAREGALSAPGVKVKYYPGCLEVEVYRD